ADLLHRLGELLTDLDVVVAGDGGDLGDLLVVLGVDLVGQAGQFLDDLVDALLDAAGEGHGVMAGGDHFEARAGDGLGQDGGGGGAVAGDVAGLAGGLLDELGAHVLVGVGQLDVLGDGDAVLGDVGAAPALVDDGVAAARAERRAHRTGQLADAGQQLLPRL